MTSVITAPTPSATDAYVARFEQFERGAVGSYPAWVLRLRTAAISLFAEAGFPTTKHEEWRFTNVAPVARLVPNFDHPRNGLNHSQLAAWSFAGLNGPRLVFVNGRYAADLSTLSGLTAGVTAGSLAQRLRADDPLAQQHLARYARCEDNPFIALNTALFEDGAFVHVPDGCAALAPIHLLFVHTTVPSGASVQTRNLIIAGRRSQAQVIEHHVSLSEMAYLNNPVTEVVVGEAAVLDHCKVQDETQTAFHIAAVQAHLERACQFSTHSISSGARITRNNIHLVMNGEGINGVLNGLYLSRGDQVVDHHTVVDHAQPHCQSHEYYHGVLDGRSRGVFNGKIFVRKDAQKTDAKQNNRNLLLSDEATIDTKPQLEIFADDVKCTHGATVGQLDDEALFYLRSRGIGTDRARQMLVHAFASDVINRIPHEPVRDQLEDLLTRRLDRPHGRDA